MWTVENGRKRIKMKTTENIAGACVCSMRIEFNLRHNVQFYRFRPFFIVDSRKRIKTLDANRSMCFRWQRKTHTFENALVWTRPKMSSPNSRCNLSDCAMIWSKLKATAKIPVQFRCLFVIELVKKKKSSNARQTQEDKAVHFAIRC